MCNIILVLVCGSSRSSSSRSACCIVYGIWECVVDASSRAIFLHDGCVIACGSSTFAVAVGDILFIDICSLAGVLV